MKSQRQRSRWREVKFMIHQVRKAIDVPLSLMTALENWNQISENLAEPPRKRKIQTHKTS
jgi:tRNA U38,U39,U40 pseudouridine synthase TruA